MPTPMPKAQQSVEPIQVVERPPSQSISIFINSSAPKNAAKLETKIKQTLLKRKAQVPTAKLNL